MIGQADFYYMTERSLRSSGQRREGKQCRICLEDNDDGTMSSPCNCKGSIQFVHRECLKEYFGHRFKAAPRAQRRKMKNKLQCEICKEPIRGLEVRSTRRCVRCDQMDQLLQAEDIFFVVVYMLLYIGFHVVGVIIIIQDTLLAKVIGSVWLAATVIAFNFGLYKLIRKLFTVRQAQVMEVVESEEVDMEL